MKAFLIFFLGLPILVSAQHLVTPSDRYANSRWEARWIGPKEGAYRYGVHYFRKSFSLKAKPYRFVIHLSADNRYRLFVNGTYVTDGPQINDTRHWRFESLDIGPLLKEGENVLAVQVANFAEEAPVYLIGKRTALIMQGDDSLSAVVNTDKTWKYLADKAVTVKGLNRRMDLSLCKRTIQVIFISVLEQDLEYLQAQNMTPVVIYTIRLQPTIFGCLS